MHDLWRDGQGLAALAFTVVAARRSFAAGAPHAPRGCSTNVNPARGPVKHDRAQILYHDTMHRRIRRRSG